MKYKSIIYDLDGTLLDSIKDIVQAVNATITHMGGRPLSIEQITKYVGKGAKNLVQQALPGLDEQQAAQAFGFFRSYYEEHCLEETALYPGVLDMLETCQKLHIKQAVFTNKPQTYTNKILKGLQISSLMDFVLGSEAGFPYKPDPEGANHILEKIGTEAKDALMVGDSLIDFETAQNAGMDCALMLNGFTPEKKLKEAKDPNTILCEDIIELKEKLGI